MPGHLAIFLLRVLNEVLRVYGHFRQGSSSLIRLLIVSFLLVAAALLLAGRAPRPIKHPWED